MAAKEVQCVVTRKQWLTPTVFELVFQAEPAFSFQAGQFISVVVPGAGPGGRNLRRAYSIASAPENPDVELCIKLVEGGPGTTYLNSLNVGDHFTGFAPSGFFTYKTPSERSVFFISTGTGIAPFRSMILSEAYRAAPPKNATLILGVTYAKELLYDSEMSAIPDLTWVKTLSRDTEPPESCLKGRLTQYFFGLDGSLNWQDADYYLCGNGAMIQEVTTFLTEKGVPKNQIHKEKYY